MTYMLILITSEEIIMARCAKCGKEATVLFTTSYGEVRCEDCWVDHLMTDKGKVEYMISICLGDTPIADYDADFLGHVGVCWKKYRDKFDLAASEIRLIENKAVELGLL
jgi:DNA-directed RNA polymerase subunit RPC12/RpoP